MKIARTQNTINGFLWGVAGKVANILLPFLLRTVMIYKLGVEYLGLNSLFASVLQVLSLSELGFSYACVYAMYKPIANDDYKTVGAILSFLKKVYAYIGVVLLGIGLLLLPFLDKIVHGSTPADINIYMLYLIYLLNSAISYFFFAYKSSLLSALQCNNLINKTNLFTNILMRLTQCTVLFLVPNYYIYVLMLPFSTLLNNFIKAYTVNKRYSRYLISSVIEPDLKTDIRRRIVPLIGIKISTVLINAADTLIISAFLGLTETALYNNYFFIMSSVQSIIYEIHSSMLAGVGNSLVVDSKDSIVKKFEILHFINMLVVAFCTVCLTCLYQTFMEIWVGSELMLHSGMVALFGAYFFSTSVQRIVIVYKDAAGVWKEDMARCYAACIINILLNILSVRYLGLYGVIGSSVFVSIAIDPWMARTVYRMVFNKSPRCFYWNLFKDAAICVVLCIVFAVGCRNLPSDWLGLFLRLVICGIGTVAALLLLYFKDPRFCQAKPWLVQTTKWLISRKHA